MKKSCDIAVLLATSGHSGVDRVMKNLLAEFGSRGFQVDLLHIRGHGPHLESPLPNVRVVDLGVAHVNSAFIPFLKYLRRENPSAILSDKTRVNRLVLWGRKLSGSEAKVAVRMGTTVSRFFAGQSWWKRQMEYQSIRLFYPWADSIIVPSRGAAEDLANLSGIPLERIRVIPSPVFGERQAKMMQEPLDHPWFDEEIPIILGVGELSANKDYATLIRAFAQVRHAMNSRLIILGEGRQREYLQTLIRELGLEKYIHMPGFVSNPYAYMARASVFAHCAHYEGAPVVLMEALSAGLPVVSTDCPSGPREILQDGRIGPLVNVGKDGEMAEAILRVLREPPAPDLLKAASQPFTIANSADRYLESLGFETGYPQSDAA